MPTPNLIIGISGGSGSGKSYLVDQIVSHFSNRRLSVISQDDYYKPKDEQKKDENNRVNFDLPEGIYFDNMHRDLMGLKSGKKVVRNKYLYNNSTMKSDEIVIEPNEIVLVEGLFVFQNIKILSMLDLKIFVEASREVMIERRSRRDLVERGYDAADVEYRYKHHVWPSYKKWIEPSKKIADVVIDNSSNNKMPIEKIALMIEKELLR